MSSLGGSASGNYSLTGITGNASAVTISQAALSITSSNVANAQTPGYIAESTNQVEVPSGGPGSAALVTGVTRELDTFIQGQLRTETGGGGFANQTSNILGQLQSLYGTPGGTGTLETAFNNFTSAVQAISTSSTGLSAGAGLVSPTKVDGPRPTTRLVI